MFKKHYKFKAGDVVKQKVTGFKVILLRKSNMFDPIGIGEWRGKAWDGSWVENNFFESELE